MAEGKYSRVYHEVMTDERFTEVWKRPALFGTWVQMLLMADLVWPIPAPLPVKTARVRHLIGLGLVLERPGNRYTIVGLDRERERRSGVGRHAADVRWQSGRNAGALPGREQTRQGHGPASPNGGKPGLHDGRHGPECTVCHPLPREVG